MSGLFFTASHSTLQQLLSFAAVQEHAGCTHLLDFP
jgi:hypothetical protein